MFIFLRCIRQGKKLRQSALVIGAMASLLLALTGVALLPTVDHANAAPRLQEPPLSPLTPANTTLPVTVTAATTATTVITTTAITTTTFTTTAVITASEALPLEAITHTEAPPAEGTAVEVTSPLTTSAIAETPARSGRPNPLLGSWSFTALLASGQISLVLVAALFVGLFTVIGLVLSRRPQ